MSLIDSEKVRIPPSLSWQGCFSTRNLTGLILLFLLVMPLLNRKGLIRTYLIYSWGKIIIIVANVKWYFFAGSPMEPEP